ncbi:hypothetical protein [Oceanobacillus damuensis]|uniref:hypothetical protein n=1 Tax=Oceanobacillus damuensis TaxID=937928 RepID=UPI000834F5A4|nr:hypothetical protein [Oceanobacillus damuensis]
MSNNQNNPDRQKLIKQLIERFEKEQLEELQDDKGKNDNSFVFLEKNTLQMFITFMLMLLDKQHNPDVREAGAESSFFKELLSYLESITEENQKTFEELIHILKEN